MRSKAAMQVAFKELEAYHGRNSLLHIEIL